MKTIFDDSIDFLLENACASIRYLVQRDLLKIPTDDPAMLALQEEILNQANVQKILAAQCEDGWLGHELHGNDGMDHLLGGLLNAGVEKENPAVQKAVHALVTRRGAGCRRSRREPCGHGADLVMGEISGGISHNG